MAITTYSELQTALTDRIARADFTAGQQQECIALAEAEMQRVLKTLDMETKNTSFSISTEYVTVPTGLLAVRDFYLNTTPKTPLRQLAGDPASLWYGGGTDRPGYYEIVGSEFRFSPPPDSTYTATIIYLAKFTPLSGSATSNWLLTAHPDAYLYGACKHAAIRLLEPDKAAAYDTLFQSALQNINTQANRSRWSGPMATRPA